MSQERKEQLMLEADGLHRAAALLSNTLADFEQADLAGRRPVVEQILAIREEWKDKRYLLATGQERRPEQAPKPTTATAGAGQQAELKLELQRVRVNISKYKSKLEEQPDHARATTWSTELARLLAIMGDIEHKLRQTTYVKSTEEN